MCLASGARAQDPGPPAEAERLEEVVVEGEADAPLSAASSQDINAQLFRLRPHTRMIEILNNIPGLVVAQHQGGKQGPATNGGLTAEILPGWSVALNVELSLQMLNLTDTAWREAQFADQSCVRGEVGRAIGCAAAPGKQTKHATDPVEDIHFTPGNPFGVLAGVTVYF